MQRTLLTLALIATAGVSYAQQPMPARAHRSLWPSADRPQRLGRQPVTGPVRPGRPRPCDEPNMATAPPLRRWLAGDVAPRWRSADAGPDRPASGDVQGRVRLPL